MPYITTNKKTNEQLLWSSRPKVVKITGISANRLRYIFGNKKQVEYNTDDFRICRVVMG